MKKYAIIGIALLGGGLFFGRGMGGELRPLAPEYPAGTGPPANAAVEVEKRVDRSVYVEFQGEVPTWTPAKKEKLRHLFLKKIREAAADKKMEAVEHYGKLLDLLDGKALHD